MNLRLDGSELGSSTSDITRAIDAFAKADRVGDDLAELTGHRGLAGKVRDFADNWDRKRGKLQTSLEGIRDALQAVIETFDDLDSKMADEANKAADGAVTVGTGSGTGGSSTGGPGTGGSSTGGSSTGGSSTGGSSTGGPSSSDLPPTPGAPDETGGGTSGVQPSILNPGILPETPDCPVPEFFTDPGLENPSIQPDPGFEHPPVHLGDPIQGGPMPITPGEPLPGGFAWPGEPLHFEAPIAYAEVPIAHLEAPIGHLEVDPTLPAFPETPLVFDPLPGHIEAPHIIGTAEAMPAFYEPAQELIPTGPELPVAQAMPAIADVPVEQRLDAVNTELGNLFIKPANGAE